MASAVRVGAPHQVRRVGGDVPVMGFTSAREVAVRRQQAVLPHQPQHPLACLLYTSPSPRD